eukprot:369250_1
MIVDDQNKSSSYAKISPKINDLKSVVINESKPPAVDIPKLNLSSRLAVRSSAKRFPAEISGTRRRDPADTDRCAPQAYALHCRAAHAPKTIGVGTIVLHFRKR